MRGGTYRSRGGHQPHRARLGWAAFLVAVLGLRVWGLGDEPPPRAEAAADPDASAPDEDEMTAARALGWLVTQVDVFEHADAAARCLRNGPACTPDDMLAPDSARARLESLAVALAAATDSSNPTYLGDPGPELAVRATRTRDTAAAAAEALGGWLAAGCGSSVEGLPVTTRPDGCGETGARAREALAAAQEDYQRWSG